jgi:ABC-2 type transport system permease protein
MTVTGTRTAGQDAPSLAVRARDVVASEWVKFWSVRSTYWTLLVAVVTPIALSDVVAFAAAQGSGSRTAGPPPDPMFSSFIGLEYAVLAVCVLGVLQFSSEYSTGLIRTTFVSVPRRRAVLAAKAAITGAVLFVAGEAVSFTSFFIVQGILHARHLGVSFAHPGVPGAVLANGAVLPVCALFALAVGAVVRHTAGGIAATIALITVPAILGLLPDHWGTRIGRFTLIDAAQQVSYLHPQTDLFSPAWSLAVLFAWPAAALTVGAVVITRSQT